MKIVACFKNVPDVRDIVINEDQTIDTAQASCAIGEYDLNAIEEGSLLAELDDSVELIALTADGPSAATPKMKKNVLSRGPHRLVVAQNDQLRTASAWDTSKALAEAIESMGDVDLVLFGEGSSDMCQQQVGSMTAAILGFNAVNAISKLEVDGEKVEATRTTEDCIQHLRINLPACISVTSDINKPRISSMKAILAAGKKPIDVMDIVVGEGKSVEVKSVLAPEKEDRKKIVFEDASDENLKKFFQEICSAI